MKTGEPFINLSKFKKIYSRKRVAFLAFSNYITAFVNLTTPRQAPGNAPARDSNFNGTFSIKV